MRAAIKKLLACLPQPMRDHLLERGKRIQDRQYTTQKQKRIRIGSFDLVVPKGHPLADLKEVQPYRDLVVGITARYITAKYPNGSIVDIGANIGDTAAIIAANSPQKMILVEPSDYFYEFLKNNVQQFPNEVVIKKEFVATGRRLTGSMHYRGGTAYFTERTDGRMEQDSVHLSEIAEPDTHFIKIDTDGYDVKILLDSLDWMRAQRPAILFENMIESDEQLRAANDLYDELHQIGYEHFVVWDDPGFHILSTDSVTPLKHLNRYLFKLKQQNFGRALSNYDILCLHRDDEDIYHSVTEWYATY